MRKRLQLKWMLTASTLLATSFTLPGAAHAAERDGASRAIATTEEHGRTIDVNDDVPAKERPAAAPRVRRSALVYWSSKENRWKPVPSANTESGKPARSAAAEVSEFYYGRDSVQSANAKILQANSHGHPATPEEIDQSIVMAVRHNVDPNRCALLLRWSRVLIPIAGSLKARWDWLQLMPKTTRESKVRNPFDPEQNADAGGRH